MAHTLGEQPEPLTIDDIQRVHGAGVYSAAYHDHGGDIRKYYDGLYSQVILDSWHAEAIVVLPDYAGAPAYAGPYCGVCTFKARQASGGCTQGVAGCAPRFDERLKYRIRLTRDLLAADVQRDRTVEGLDHMLPRRGRMSESEPLLCSTAGGWAGALDPNHDGRLQKAAFLRKNVAYTTVTIPKANGKVRRLHVPCGPLMELQRRVLDLTLNRCVWPEHVAAYVPGRQLIDTAKQHAGRPLVITLDLKNFFGSTTHAMVHDALVEAYGYIALGALPHEDIAFFQNSSAYVARLLWRESALRYEDMEKKARGAVLYLTDLVTCPVDLRRPDSPRVLPQGAPTSGAFANLVAVHRLDPHVLRICAQHGMTYSRYADDLIFSSERDLTREETSTFIESIAAAVFQSGYRVNWDKLRVQRRHQQQRVLGLVVNDGTPRVPRKTRKLLRAQHHYMSTCGIEAAAARNLPEDFRLPEGASREEVFLRQHKGRAGYVAHVLPDHMRSIYNVSPDVWARSV